MDKAQSGKSLPGLSNQGTPLLAAERFRYKTLIYLDPECVRFFGKGSKTLYPGQQILEEHGFCDLIRLGVGLLYHRSIQGGLTRS
jgi:hypothetical protein